MDMPHMAMLPSIGDEEMASGNQHAPTVPALGLLEGRPTPTWLALISLTSHASRIVRLRPAASPPRPTARAAHRL